MHEISAERVLEVVRDFDAHGGASIELVAWELSLQPQEIAGAWSEAIDRLLLREVDALPRSALELEVAVADEQMWRLSAAGWVALGVDPDLDRQRAVAIAQLGILERISDPALNALTRVTAYVLGTNGSAVHIFDDRYQHRIAAVNAPLEKHPAHNTLCRKVVDSGQAIITADASADDRFAYSTFTRGEDRVRFFAATPLRAAPDGLVVGTLCAFGSEVKQISEEQIRLLDDLAEMAIAQIECTRMAIGRFVASAPVGSA